MKPDVVDMNKVDKKEFDLQKAFGPIPESFTRALQNVLNHIRYEEGSLVGQCEKEHGHETSAEKS